MENKSKTDIYKLVSSQNRVQLIVCLEKSQSVTELLARCELSQSALSQHLKILKEGGIIACKRDGKKQIYSIKNKKIVRVAKLLLGFDK